MSGDSRELVKLASQGDTPAVDELLARHLPGLRAFIRLRAGPVIRRRESESDLAQSVCREVLEHLDRFQYGDETGFKRWLYTTALRKILNRYEYYAAEKRNFLREEAADGASSGSSMSGGRPLAQYYRTFSTPSEHAMKAEEIERVEKAFDGLQEDQREVITLAHVVGLSRAEMAAQLGKSEGAVRTMLSRALAQLAELLDGD
jgi:RNA polymerase sigma-70 factor (ECF subfamily)